MSILGFDSPISQREFLSLANLDELQQAVRDVNENNGWFDADRSLAEDIVLVGSEYGELCEALRDSEHPAPRHWYSGEKKKPEGVMSEVVDIMIRLFDLAERHEKDAGITLSEAFGEKLLYNAHKRSYRHGNKAL